MNRLYKTYIKIYTKPAIWFFVSGLVYSVAFLKSYLFFFVFAGLSLFLFRFFNDDIQKKPFKYIFIFFWGFYISLYKWFYELYPFEGFDLTKFQGIAIVFIAIFGIAALHALETALIFKLFRYLPKHQWLLPVNTAVLIMLSEWFISLGALGFAWGTPAVALYRFLPYIQNLSLFGAYFITFIAVCFSGYLVLFIKYKKFLYLKVTAAFLIIPLISGTILLYIPQKKNTPVKAAIIQGNILSMDKWREEDSLNHLKLYINLTEEAAKMGSELIILPESAIPILFTDNGIVKHKLSEIAVNYKCTIIVGILTKTHDNYRQNSMVMINPDGSVSDYYNKRHLVPFGEAVPYRAFFDMFLPFFNNINLDKNEYIPGESSSLFNYKDIKIGGLICYDSIFASLASQSVSDGADMLVLCTNDSWYNDSAAVYQHLAHSVLRAIENGRPVVRAANTGVSCFIDEKGRITNKTLPLTQDIIISEIYPVNSTTLYSIIGDFFLYLAMLYILICIINNTIKRYKNGKNKVI